jgi:ribokinase
MSRPIVVVGSINADIYLEVHRLPAPGETIATTVSPVILPGGKGANQAAAAARLASTGCAFMVGQVGASDAHGTEMLACANACGVDTSLVARHPTAATGQAYILLQQSGENSIIIVGGANVDWPADAPLRADALEAISQASCLLLQREVPENVNVAAARAARAARVPVVLDVGGAEDELSAELLALCTCVSPNETELARLTALPTETDEQVFAAARTLVDAGVAEVVVKLGARGCVRVAGALSEPPIWQPAFPVACVVDTTGAGDCFTGAYAVACADGAAPAAALRFATAAASLSVQHKGAMPSMPTRAAVEALLARDLGS